MAATLSFFLPGFGQIYAGKAERGASILVGFILVFTAAYFFIAQTTGRGILFDIGSRYLQLLAILFWAGRSMTPTALRRPNYSVTHRPSRQPI